MLQNINEHFDDNCLWIHNFIIHFKKYWVILLQKSNIMCDNFLVKRHAWFILQWHQLFNNIDKLNEITIT